MAVKTISYITRDYEGCRQALIDKSKKYYPDVFGALDDASVGQWLIDLMSDVYDNMNFHIDRMYQETTLDGAQQLSSLQSMARTNGLRIPGKKSALCEIELSVEIPTGANNGTLYANEDYCPVIKRGTLFSTGMVTFELMNDVDFTEQFNENGVSDRQIIPNRDSNGNITSYTYKKLAVVSAGQSKIYKKIITDSDITPFLTITLQDNNILGVESIIMKEGSKLQNDPDISEFYVDKEIYTGRDGTSEIKRFFEVDNLLDQYRFGYEVEETDGNDGKSKYYNPIWEPMKEFEIVDEKNDETFIPVRIAKGKWKRLKHKFITEYTDNWYMDVTFGAGIEDGSGLIPPNAAPFTQYMMSRMMANNAMGVLPSSGHTIYILYRVGGGEISNIAAGTLTNIVYLNMEMKCDTNLDAVLKRRVRTSLSVTNTTPSYGGKDEPSAEEIKYMIKYNNSAQRRCVTLHDYYSRINEMPAKFGMPFRIGVIEENNKVVIYALGLDANGNLTPNLSETVAENIKEYLSMYRTINDFVEIRSGKVINIAFNLTIYVDKTYDKAEVVKRVIDTVYDYMDIRKHQLGEDIYLGDLQREVSHLDGVMNLVNLRCYNKTGEGYSDAEISQELVDDADCCQKEEDYTNDDDTSSEIDLRASDYILFSDANAMFEIKNKGLDISVTVKTR